MNLPTPVPEIPVRDLAAATAYYERNMGFVVDWRDDDLGLAGISNGDCRLFLATQEFRQQYGNTGPVLTWLNMSSGDAVDRLHETWRTNGATLVSAPESKSWGLREFTAADPDGNLFRVFYDFATPERESSS